MIFTCLSLLRFVGSAPLLSNSVTICFLPLWKKIKVVKWQKKHYQNGDHGDNGDHLRGNV